MRGHGMYGGSCGCGSMRRFESKSERKERLSEYVQELKKETTAAEEALKEIDA